MIIDKILNNNVITDKNDKNLEKVIMGRGIAFQKKVGDNVDESKIEKVLAPLLTWSPSNAFFT